MQYFYFIAAFAAFFIGIWGYKTGLQDGLDINKGKCIKPVTSPVKQAYKGLVVDKQNKEMKEQEAEFMDNLNSLLAYTGDIKKGADQ